MRETIGVVKLAQGQAGFYDPLTNIHLTVLDPEKPVFSGSDTQNLRRAVRIGTIRLIRGTLQTREKSKIKIPKIEEVVKKVKVQEKAKVELPKKVESKKVELKKAEEKVEASKKVNKSKKDK